MSDFLAQLKRRNIYRVAAAYAVVAWVLVQLVGNLAPMFDLPSWIARAVVLLLIVGLPVVLLIALMRELAPADGTKAATGMLDWALMAALALVIVLLSYQQLWSGTGSGAPRQASLASTPPLQSRAETGSPDH